MFNSVKNSVRLQIGKYGQRVCVREFMDRFANNLNQHQSEKSLTSHVRGCGQPTATTHPHLLKEGEVVPGIQLEEFKSRRNKLMESIVSNSAKSHIVIIPASSKVYMTDKIPYVFRQNTDFLYFTGCQEPDNILVITAKNKNFLTTLFMRQRDEHTELWDGPRTEVEAAPRIFGIDLALPITEFEKYFVSFMNEDRESIIWYDNVETATSSLHTKLHRLIKGFDNRAFVSPMSIIHTIRLIKSQSEISLMKKSCEIVSAAISRTIEMSKPGMSEHQLFAIVDYECRMNGAEFLAYPPVVAAGKNANIIHYINNNQIILNGDMILMDAGCEYHGYASDVTRTWPVNGTFTKEQKILYEIVLDIQYILIHRLNERFPLDQLFHEMCGLLGKRLQEIGLIPKHLSGNRLLSAAYSYCPHHVSHYLGMDVHDTGKVSRGIKLQSGMIVTVEPGIYVNPKNEFAPSEFHGLGIRVEDDILITDDGPIILTEKCPKGIAETEALASQNL